MFEMTEEKFRLNEGHYYVMSHIGSLRKLACAIYRDFFSAVKLDKFTRKILIVLIFLLKTYIVGTR